MKPKLSLEEKNIYIQTENIINSMNEHIKYNDITSKTEINFPSIFEHLQHIPIEEKNSNIDNSIIYLTTQKNDSNKNSIELNESFKANNNHNFIEQRSIDIQLENTTKNNKYNKDKDKISKGKEKSLKNNKNYNINLLNSKDIKIRKIINIKNIKPNLINLKSLNQILNKGTKLCNSIDNNHFSNKKETKINKIASIKKKELSKKSINENMLNQNSSNLLELNSKGIKNLKESNLSRNNLINKRIKTSQGIKIKNIKELTKKNRYENDSLLDIFSKQQKCYSSSNHSLKAKDNINSFHFGINNSKIMDDKFLSGMKNERRKNSLKNAISIYNRMKNSYNFKNINYYNIPIISGLNDDQNKNEQKVDKQENINNEKDKKDNNINIEDKENDSEFSFIDNIKKKEENIEEKNEEKNKEKIIIKDNFKTNDSNEEYKFEVLNNISNKNENSVYLKENEIQGINEEINNLNNNIEELKDFKNEEDDDFVNDIENIEDNEKEVNIEKNKNISQPSFFIRQLLREEHYYIDENGKEKLLEIKQKYLNDSNKPKINAPYIKKNIKNIINHNKINEKRKKSLILNLKENQSPRITRNIDINNKILLNNYKKINLLKDKHSLTWIDNNKSNKKVETIKLTDFENGENSILKNNIFKNINNDNKRRNSNYGQHKTQSNTDYENDFNSSLKREIFDSNNNINFQRNLINIKKDKPIIINSFNYVGNSSKISSPRNLIIKNINLKEGQSLITKQRINNLDSKTYNENDSINYLDNFIKVNKTKKNNTIKKINVNKNNKFVKRDFNKKHHNFHEIKITKNKLTSNSQSNYFSKDFSLEEPNTSNQLNGIHKISGKLVNKNKNDISNFSHKNSNLRRIIGLNYFLNRQNNFELKSNSESLFNLNIKKQKNRNNNEKSNHKYYESKSTKKTLKNSGYESDGNIGRINTYSLNLDKNNSNNIHKGKYFYQKWDINNNRIATQYNNE